MVPALCAVLLLAGLTPEEEVEAWQPPMPTARREEPKTQVPYELGVGATFGFNLATNTDVFEMGPGIGASLRGGRDVLFTAAMDIVPVPLVSASPRYVGTNGGYSMPFATLSIGVGWRVVREDVFEAGVGAAPFVGLGAYTCGDCISMAPGIGISPSAFMTWGARDGMRMTMRTQAPTGLSLGNGLFFAGFMTVEATFSWDR